MNIEVELLEISNGKCPYLEWEGKLNKIACAAVRRRINRLRFGNFGDCSPIKGATGLHELRVHLGPGYRLYFGKNTNILVILLCGGDKSTQTRDIEKAKEYWQLYNDSRRNM